ncbi:MAG: FAD:protein FMN transferase [Lachnospiraceae bacterium]|nr:FAD:protein FMN transferase [Lachnospiraceae bacterium]
MKTNIKITLVSLLSALLLSGCLASNNRPYSRSGLYYDTIISVTLYGVGKNDADLLLDECMTICDHYGSLFDPDINTSDIAKINSSGGKSITVDPDTILCLSETLKYSGISDGKFDITIKPVSDLWDFHEGSGKIPSADRLNNALNYVGYKKITIDPVNNTVSLEPGSSIELGASAKGFIAGKISEYLKKNNVSGAIINMGGDICLLGSKPDGSDFNIGISDPDSSGAPVLTLTLNNTSVATSGTYERCFTYEGQKYHHILDPSTGYPVKTDVLSVTVISDSAIDCDCLCTLCILEGTPKALSLINSIPDTEAIIIQNDGKIVKSSGADRYIKN